MQMFIWNNIFFSLGFDVRDHYKELGGDAAAFVAPKNDLQGLRVYAAIDLPGPYTLGTVVIDYRFVRSQIHASLSSHYLYDVGIL